MGKKLVRQFKTHNAPAGARGYRTQATVEHPQLPPAGVVNVTPGGIPVPTADGVVSIRATPERPMTVPPAEVRTPRAMGTPALPPDWYPETPNRIWTPDASSGTRRNTGAEDIPATVPFVDLTTNTTLPPQKPTLPYGQPNFPTVDITPEQFTLPPQSQQQIIHERPTTIDYGPITTPIERPIQEDMGYIDTQQPIDLTPGHQVVATETSSFEPQPVESAYAYPIQVDYPQPTLNDPNPVTDTVETDEITNLIDTLLPEQQEAKTIQIYEEGPQWVEDPHALAAQEAIDQGGFDQTDPSLIDRGLPPIIDQSPEITYHGNLADWDAYNDPFVIDYSDTYGEPTLPQQEFPQVFTPEPIVEQPPITQPPELGMPEIPVVPAVDDDPISAADIRAGLGTIEEIPLPTGESIGITPETVQPPIGANPMVEATITSNPDLVVPVAADTSTTGGTVAGGVQAGDDFFWEDRQYKNPQESTGVNEQFAIPDDGPIERDPVGAAAIVEAEKPVRQRKEGPEFLVDPVVDDKEEFKGGPVTSNIQGKTVEYDVDPRDFQDSRDLRQSEDPPLVDTSGVDTGVDTTGQEKTQTQTAVTQPPVGGRKWVHTGSGDFAETLHQFKTNRGSSGPPIVTDTPAVSGPVVNRETGEITREPLTWHQFNPAGSSVSPYTEGINTGTGTETGAKGPPDVTGVSATSGTGRGGEGKVPFQTFLEGQDTAGSLIPGGLNLDMASLKGQAGINQLRSEVTKKDFEGIDSLEGLGNFFDLKPAFQGFGESIAGVLQELTGMEDGDLKGPGLWDTLNTPIPAFTTGEFGITPLDIITVIASGTAAIGPILVKKFMDSLMQPFEGAVTDGLKGVFNNVFKRGGAGEKYNESPVSQENINAADLEVLAEELGIDKPSGMIEAGTYYGADGVVIARNMKPLDFGLNTVDGANSFKDVLNAVGAKTDPGYTSVKYNTQTGQIDVVHADGSVTESASHITIDSEGNMQQGTGRGKKTKKVNWGVRVIGVNAIDTVAPRSDKGKGKGKGKGGSIWDWIKDKLPGKDDDEEDTTKKESGN